MTETARGAQRAPLLPPLAAILLAVVGTSLMMWGFVAGIGAALDGSGSGAGVYPIIFLIGAALDLTALVLAIVGIARGRRRGLSGLALGFALVPIALVGLTAYAANVGF